MACSKTILYELYYPFCVILSSAWLLVKAFTDLKHLVTYMTAFTHSGFRDQERNFSHVKTSFRIVKPGLALSFIFRVVFTPGFAARIVKLQSVNSVTRKLDHTMCIVWD